MLGYVRVTEGDFGSARALCPGNNLVAHAHMESHIIIPLVDSSPCELLVGDKELIPLESGTAVLVNPLEVHSFHTNCPHGEPIFLVFYINPQWLSSQFGLPVALPFSLRKIELDSESLRSARSLADRILSSASDDADLLNKLLFFIEEVFTHSAIQDYQFNQLLLPRSDFRIRKAMQIMSENLDTRLPLNSVARLAGISRPHFFSLFHQQFDMSPKTYWNVLRLEKAMSELKTSPLQLQSISEDLGFSSQGNFSRFFRDRTGIAPKQFQHAVR